MSALYGWQVLRVAIAALLPRVQEKVTCFTNKKDTMGTIKVGQTSPRRYGSTGVTSVTIKVKASTDVEPASAQAPAPEPPAEVVEANTVVAAPAEESVARKPRKKTSKKK